VDNHACPTNKMMQHFVFVLIYIYLFSRIFLYIQYTGKLMSQLLKLLALMIFALPNIAYAHAVAGGGGFMSGLSHPVLGFDHLLAMLSVGILSAQIGGSAIWKVPAAFVSVMLVGGILGMNGVYFMSVELGIVVSVFALGLAITLDQKLPLLITIFFVGFFALFHGHAHGSEMPYLAKPLFYACGFVVGTTVIHIAGVMVGVMAKKIKHGAQILRYLGAGIAGIGFYLIILL
jgi:urease accessory protein